jgi:hypothetical protein
MASRCHGDAKVMALLLKNYEAGDSRVGVPAFDILKQFN